MKEGKAMNHDARYDVHYPNGRWCMTTNAPGLMGVLGLRKEAISRIEAETANGGTCKLHFERLTPWATNEYWVTLLD